VATALSPSGPGAPALLVLFGSLQFPVPCAGLDQRVLSGTEWTPYLALSWARIVRLHEAPRRNFRFAPSPWVEGASGCCGCDQHQLRTQVLQPAAVA